METHPTDVLKQYWGYPSFRPLQLEIIESVLSSHDTLALLPTGGGKSICFQVPGLLLEGITIVISPLIALMKDQVEQLVKRKINAVAIYSGLKKADIDRILDNCVYGGVKFLYISPERLNTDLFKERIKKMRVSLLVVDEAHCVSQWGYDFRPPYLSIGRFKEEHLPSVKYIALTASATPEVKLDLIDKLHFDKENHQIFEKSFSRANLSYSVLHETNKPARLLYMLNRVPGTAIVYVRNRKKTKQVALWLHEQGVSADFYHAGLAGDVRAKKQNHWIGNQVRVMVSTNAFGMGIDKPDVRLVVHLDLPDTLEAYYQEAGRAGRDEKKAYAVLLYNDRDIKSLHENHIQSYPSLEKLKHLYNCLAVHFKLAVGSGFMVSYPIQLVGFVQKFSLDPFQTYSGLKRLEELGLIQYSTRGTAFSSLVIKVNSRDLYKFIVDHPVYESLLEQLLRLYGGELYHGIQKVNEVELGQHCGLNPSRVKYLLEHLNQMDIVLYEPASDHDLITFVTPRRAVESLGIDRLYYEQRQQLAASKMKAVEEYIKDNDYCRTKKIVSYFGENLKTACGVCDVCTKKNKKSALSTSQSNIESLLGLLKKGAYYPDDLKRHLNWKDEVFSQTISFLMEEGMIAYDENGKIFAI
ncbi:MAG: RecQ family ATP-dependent DNA helicase [Cyclobacteriaceae bacterium]|nr:RecQ family ATP-dependent DNA helicase [Cyclobacteriaceae bacterium]MCH8515151.1 RecQ family ATP-dependent DNA helicase [Cyclobacteriaceae bacterium]